MEHTDYCFARLYEYYKINFAFFHSCCTIPLSLLFYFFPMFSEFFLKCSQFLYQLSSKQFPKAVAKSTSNKPQKFWKGTSQFNTCSLHYLLVSIRVKIGRQEEEKKNNSFSFLIWAQSEPCFSWTAQFYWTTTFRCLVIICSSIPEV